jgi:hypothetical protein
LYFVQFWVFNRDKKVVGVFVHFRAPLQRNFKYGLGRRCVGEMGAMQRWKMITFFSSAFETLGELSNGVEDTVASTTDTDERAYHERVR